jgi:hypothetical protein
MRNGPNILWDLEWYRCLIAVIRSKNKIAIAACERFGF